MTEHTQTVPDQHSNVVGGSTAARRINCPASYALEQKVPEDKGSVYANEGTTLHEMMTILLNDDTKNPEDLLPFHFKHKDGWEMTINEDVWYDLGQPALDAFLDFMDAIEEETGGTFEYVVECRCEMPGIDGAFGTVDIVWRCGEDVGGVWDWKFGHGPVPAVENSQLLYYARAAIHSFPKLLGPVRYFWLTIMQPQRSHEPDHWPVDRERIDAFYDELHDSLRVALSEGEDAPMARGSWCNFARCKAICPLHVNPAVRLGQLMAARKDDEQQVLDDGEPALSDYEAVGDEPTFVEMLPDLLELAEIARDWSKEVFGRAQRLAEDDPAALEAIEAVGWGLKPKRAGAREWAVAEGTVRRGAKKLAGLGVNDVAPRQLVSPTQLEKLFKRQDVALPEKWTTRPASSGATLTRLSEGTERYQTNRQKVADLGTRLASIAKR